MSSQAINNPQNSKLTKLSFQNLRKTASKEDYQIQNQQQFLNFYLTDPFFKAKLDFKLQEIQKWFKTKNKKLIKPHIPTTIFTNVDVFSLKLDINYDLEEIQKQYFYLKDITENIKN